MCKKAFLIILMWTENYMKSLYHSSQTFRALEQQCQAASLQAGCIIQKLRPSQLQQCKKSHVVTRAKFDTRALEEIISTLKFRKK